MGGVKLVVGGQKGGRCVKGRGSSHMAAASALQRLQERPVSGWSGLTFVLSGDTCSRLYFVRDLGLGIGYIV